MQRPDTSAGRHLGMAIGFLFVAACVVAAPVFIWLWVTEAPPALTSGEAPDA
jgi:hypothetical protein